MYASLSIILNTKGYFVDNLIGEPLVNLVLVGFNLTRIFGIISCLKEKFCKCSNAGKFGNSSVLIGKLGGSSVLREKNSVLLQLPLDHLVILLV